MALENKRHKQDKASRWWAIAVGTGLALSPVHNQWLTNLATNSKGEVLFFLPAFGYLLLIMGTGLFLLNHWGKVKEVGWGNERVVFCLLLIVVAIALSGSAYTGWQDRIAPLGMGLALFALYLASRVLGRDIFLPLAVGAAVASLGVILHGIIFPGQVTGGFVFEQNYDIVVGYILLGTAMYSGRYYLPLIALALVALFLSGSPEAVFSMFILGIVVILRRDWSKKLLPVLAGVFILGGIWFGLGYGQDLFSYTMRVASGEATAVENRVEVARDAKADIKPLGDGYNITGFTRETVHNVPLIIVQQLGYPGVLAALAWLWVSLYCLIRTKWKYAWVLVLALGVFDHYTWTQLAPWWWAIVGVSMTGGVESDLVFRKERVKHLPSSIRERLERIRATYLANQEVYE